MNLKVVNPISRDGLFKRGHDEYVERMKQTKEFYARKPHGGKQSQKIVCLIIICSQQVIIYLKFSKDFKLHSPFGHT